MVASLLDPTRPDDAHTAERLATEPIAWLGSTRPDGRPHQVPVWFWWADAEVVVFSLPGAQKLRNIAHQPHVSLHLDSAAGGGDIVVAEGTAAPVDGDAVGHLADGFAAKYAPMLGPGGFAAWRATFTRPVLVTVTRVVAWTRTGGELAYRSVPSDPSRV